MGNFGTLWSSLKLNISDFSNKLETAAGQVNRFAADINGKTVGAMRELNKQTNAWGLNLKSVSRVVSGIVISQTFYQILRSVREATNAVWEFTKQLETAQVAYSNLFGDVSLATEFINVLKDFAAKTPFSFTEAEAAAKRLLAYGIEYKNVMYVMQGVLSAASIQGDSAKIESISRALGQIYTYGKLMTQEVRQLSEAGIPAYEILQEELGLTQEQLRNLGNEGIPASLAINALVDGIQKRFGTAAEAAAKTTTGLISNIKDNAVMLFSGLFEPLSMFIKSALASLGELMFALREIYELKGAGGVFEALFPEEMHGVLRQFIANLSILGQSVVRLVHALGGLLKPVLDALINVFNAFAPIIAQIANVLAELIRIITSNATAMRNLTLALTAAAAMWVVFKVRALATAVITGVLTAISKSLMVLRAALTFVAAHPFWALLIVLTGVLVGVSSGFGQLSEKVSDFFSKLTQFNGVDPDKVLLPSQKERANDLDKFNDRLEGTSDAMDDLADSTGKATKAAKGLLSFDEVFKLNEPDEGTNGGIDVDGLEDLLEGLDGLGSGYIPEVPDFSDYFNGLETNFLAGYKKAWDKIKEKLEPIASTAIAAGFGYLLGRLLGGKVGGVLGAIAGAIVGYFWNKLADYFNLTPDQKINAGIIGGVGALIGAALGGIVGGPLGAKIGAIIGGFVGSFWGIFAEHLGVIPEQHFATVISGAFSGALYAGLALLSSLLKNLTPVFIDDVFSGFARNVGFSLKNALTGALKQGVKGAIVGLVTGMLSNAITAWIAGELELTEQDLKNAGTGQIVGNIIGSITGIILGGPAGSLIGGALGQLGGSIIGEFWNYMTNALKGAVIGGASGLPIGAIVGTVVGSVGGPLGAAIGAAIGVALGGLVGLIIDHWEPIKEFFSDVGSVISDGAGLVVDGFKSIGSGIGDLLNGDFALLDGVISLATDAFNSVKDAVTGFGEAVSEKLEPAIKFVKDMFSGVTTVFKDLKKGVETVWNDISSAVSTVLTDIWSAITTVWNDISSAVSTVLEDIGSAVSTVWNDISSAVSTVCTEVWEVVSGIFNLVKDLIIKVVTDIWNSVVEFFSPIAEEVSRVCQEIWNSVSKAFTDAFNFVAQKLQAIWTTVSNKFMSIVNTIKTHLTNALNAIKTKFTEIYTFISSKLTDALNAVKNKFKEIYNTISSWVTSALTKVKEKFQEIYSSISSFVSDAYSKVKNKFSDIYSTIKSKVTDSYSTVKSNFSSMYEKVSGSVTDMYSSVKEGVKNIYETFTSWISDLWDNVFGKFFDWVDEGIDKLREFFGLESDAKSSSYSSSSSKNNGGGGGHMRGHATGGIFDREHVARFAEGNKAEAIIPLENDTAMQPFVTAVADGLTASLAPLLANFSSNNNNQLQPLYVGTLIADERSLKELERKMEVIRIQENRR